MCALHIESTIGALVTEGFFSLRYTDNCGRVEYWIKLSNISCCPHTYTRSPELIVIDFYEYNLFKGEVIAFWVVKSENWPEELTSTQVQGVLTMAQPFYYFSLALAALGHIYHCVVLRRSKNGAPLYFKWNPSALFGWTNVTKGLEQWQPFAKTDLIDVRLKQHITDLNTY